MCLSSSCDYICLIFGAFIYRGLFIQIFFFPHNFLLRIQIVSLTSRPTPARAATTCLSQKTASRNGYSQHILKSAFQSWREETINHRGLNLVEMKMYVKCQSSDRNHSKAVPVTVIFRTLSISFQITLSWMFQLSHVLPFWLFSTARWLLLQHHGSLMNFLLQLD